jgi:type IV pilus assembly protein PilW
MTARKTGIAQSRQIASGGFTLIEIMVTLVLVGILLAGLVELFVSTKRNSAATDELSRIQETGRIAIQMLSSDVRRAGYLAGNVLPEAISGTLGASDPNAPNTVNCAAGDNTWGRKVGQAIAGIDDDHTAYACLTDAEHLRGDVLTVRYASSWPIPVGSMGAGGLYFRTNVVEGRIFDGTNAGSATNTLVGAGVEDFALIAHSYFVGSTGRSCRGEAIPALFRKSLSATTGQPINEELLPGVEHLQFRYLENSRYRDADTVTDWADVSAVEIAVLVRAECPETGFENSRDFTLGDLGAGAYGPDDAFRRQLFTTVTTIRSRG